MDRTVVVTGADEEPGGAIARVMAETAGTLIIGGRDQAELSTVGSDVDSDERSVITQRADARDEFDLERLLETGAREGGPIDVVVPAQVAAHDRDGVKPLPLVSYSAFDDVLRATLRGAFSTIREAAPHLSQDWTVLLPIPATDSPEDGSRPLSVAASGRRGLLSLAAADIDASIVGVEYEPLPADGEGAAADHSIGKAAVIALEAATSLDGTVKAVDSLLADG